MMTFSNLTFAVELIALSFGVAHLIWGFRNKGTTGAGLAKIFGYFITIVAVLLLICTLWHSSMFSMHVTSVQYMSK